MKILFNIPNISKQSGGIYQYSITLLKILAKSNLSHHFFVYSNINDTDLQNIVRVNSNLFYTIENEPFTHKLKRNFFESLSFFSKKFRIPINLPQIDFYDLLIKKYNIDIIHTPYQGIVAKKNTPTITTMHDVQELHFPEFFTSDERAYRAVNYKKAIDNADAVIVSYNHVKDDIHKYFNKPRNQIFTVLLDMEELWFKKFENIDVKSSENHNIPADFLLYPAATWEHKNHLRLIEAIAQLKEENIIVNLVCTGYQTPFFKDIIIPRIDLCGLDNQVFFLGIVPDMDLYILYKNCRAIVIPTLYEAGSFPLMESILMNIPVICSNVTSLPETIGDKRFVFDPYVVNDIKSKVKKIWFEDNYRKENFITIEKQALKLRNNNNNAAYNVDKIYSDLFATR